MVSYLMLQVRAPDILLKKYYISIDASWCPILLIPSQKAISKLLITLLAGAIPHPPIAYVKHMLWELNGIVQLFNAWLPSPYGRCGSVQSYPVKL